MTIHPLLTLFLLVTSLTQAEPDQTAIDRKALVHRHNPGLQTVNPLSPFSVGNGAFAFTADITGLQSFPEHYAEHGIPLSVQSEWGWHSLPNPNDYQIEDTYKDVVTQDRLVPYPIDQSSPAGQFGRSNPHRLGLANIGFKFYHADGSTVNIDRIQYVNQTLDLYTGRLTSSFSIDEVSVKVTTICHPGSDAISVLTESPLVSNGQLHIQINFPYGNPGWGLQPEDWDSPNSHVSQLEDRTPGEARISRQLDQDSYRVHLRFDKSADIEEAGKHHFLISPKIGSSQTFEFTARFLPGADDDNLPTPNLPDGLTHSEAHWKEFWQSGGVIDLSASSDPRAKELERRIVLSQYLTAIQCGGRLPPQETGLTANSWYGKPHLEMHWWHGIHFALWNRLPYLENTLPWYQEVLPKAKEIAQTQGYPGARWPKNVDAAGNQVASTISPLLIWQQPHPIYYAELCYRAHPTLETLRRYDEIVQQTATFMAAFPHQNPDTGNFDLGPPLIPAQESYDYRTTSNPPFELAYWRWGLETGQKWRERQGLSRHPNWDDVLTKLAPYPIYDDLYATAQGMWNPKDHPSVLAIKGMLPGSEVDDERLRRTLRHVLNTYDWQHTWGWDYPMMAMTAARLGEPELAIQALMLDVQKNTYLPNGHNYQNERLRLYLPGNGGLLAAVAMMAAGWDGASDTQAPGFPQDGTWQVKWEDLSPMP
ncbi:hypothetical protein [Pelagicoccus sp. SDUM812002]|uniref:hypothetical protein n=1 Tax=Pelagicoccus sp. SDUM812002 TaxID=3041266 RepID=UPI00280EB4DA|nr:hypothetical protein [Pelagicoccus sp. SDUM812002]MDQ8185148.1 hypothetical protein [Pelagicoccus sp. SDUM812002]